MPNFTVKNLTDGNVNTGAGRNLGAGASIQLDALTGEIIRAYRRGALSVTPAVGTGGALSSTGLVDNSGGTASGTIGAIGTTYAQAEVRNAIASVIAVTNGANARIAALEKLVYDVLLDRFN